ncbi:MAG: acyl-CoA/acyl-ACP dehydrogenase [Myxococcales bacterium]|nr:acyl-CoA/acyl-ACP dehydrogenase [Myxococcales bacterium]
MNFDFSEEQKLLQQTARDYLEEHCQLDAARQVLESSAPYASDLWKGVAEMGWLGAAIPEAYGGAGFGHLELALIAQELGRALAPIPFSSSVYLATEALLLAGTPEQRTRYLPGLASGERIGTLAHSEGAGRGGSPGLTTRIEGDRVSGTKIPVPDGDVAGLIVAVVRDADATSLALVELPCEGVDVEALDSIDPSRSQARVTLNDAPAEILGERGAGEDLAARLLDRAATLMAFEQIGGAERALSITRDFCMNRYAFGRPIASFQALKHRLADLFVAIELAKSNAYYAAWALQNDEPDLATAACSARASASDAFELASKEMIQMHGGVGFTWEYDCHLFYRRSKLLAVTLGSADLWRDRLIERLTG